MVSIVQDLKKKELIHPPSWLPNAVQYECIMGSEAYGVSQDSSDRDIYGFCIPKKDMVFPHLAGEILGFGRQKKRFEQYQKHHIEETGSQTNYDLSIYGIVKYFQLLMDNNPNIIDSIFVPRECIIYSTQVGEIVRENRQSFLHKGCFHKFKGYAFSQLSRAENALKSDEMKAILEFEDRYRIAHTRRYDSIDSLLLNLEEKARYRQLWHNGLNKTKRFENQKILGGDTKFMYHIVRLCDECDQILSTGDLDLRRAKEQMKAVRNGDWKLKDIKDWFAEQEKTLEKLYRESSLPNCPDEEKIKKILLSCLETYFGSLDKCVIDTNREKEILNRIKELVGV